MTDPLTLAHARVEAGDFDAAVALLRQAETTADVVGINLARCHIAGVSPAHEALLEPALAAISQLVDVDREPEVGPIWHAYGVLAALRSRDDDAGRSVEDFAAVVTRLGVAARSARLVAATFQNLDRFGRLDLAAPLHRLVEGIEPPDEETRADLAVWLRMSGAGAMAERMCDTVLGRAPAGRAWARAAVTKGVQCAVTSRFEEARDLLTRALRIAADGGWTDVADAARDNLFVTFVHSGETVELARTVRAWLTEIDSGDQPMPSVARALKLARAFRLAGSDLLALDLLSRFADHPWTDETDADQLAWLEVFVEVFRALADDFTAAELCLRAIGIDDRLSAGLARLRHQDYERIARAYELLVTFYAELERFDDGMRERCLAYLEASKEAAFSRAMPELWHDAHSAEMRALTEELARLEAMSERLVHGDSSVRAAGSGRVVFRPAYETERHRDRRTREIKDRLQELRRTPQARLTRFPSFLAHGAERLSRSMAAADRPEPMLSLAYRLDRAENELVGYLVTADGRVHRHVADIDVTLLDAQLTVLSHHPEDELDFVVDRLTGMLLPEPLRDALFSSDAETLLVSGDTGMLSVPWEALGTGTDRLGLRFSLARSPSLLRTFSRDTVPAPAIDRALIVADPTGDLPAAAQEGELVQQLLADHGVPATVLRSCTRDEFVTELPRHAFVHFAGHTDYLRTDPASSYFSFSDGPLTVTELAHTDLHPQALVVLGSCESAQAGQETGSANHFGIGAILLLKGAAAVIGSNWPAEDLASLTAIGHYYSHLLDGSPVATAVRAARRSMRDRGEPLENWALYTALGDPFHRIAISGDPLRPTLTE